MDSSFFAIRYLDFGGKYYADSAITQEVLDELIRKVRRGSISSFLLSLDEYGEEDFFHGDLADGWAVLNYNTWDEEGEAHMQLPVNPDYADSKEDAPVEIGGQTSVLIWRQSVFSTLPKLERYTLAFGGKNSET